MKWQFNEFIQYFDSVRLGGKIEIRLKLSANEVRYLNQIGPNTAGHRGLDQMRWRVSSNILADYKNQPLTA